MQKNNMLWWPIVIALLLTGFIIGWTTKPSKTVKDPFTVKIHDTLKTTSVQYKIIPGADYNIDSLITVINQFWKDSLKNMYGKGLFQAKYSKEDALGKRDYTLASRIPLDPESQLTVDETFVFPKKTFGLVGSIGSSTSLAIKYYLHDSPKFSFSGQVGYEYLFAIKNWNYSARFELEYKF
jgi:hypothetical protein